MTNRSPRARWRSCAAAAATVALSAVAVGCGLFGTDVGVTGVRTQWVTPADQNGRRALVVASEDQDLTDATSKLPIVMVLHGLNGGAEDMARMAEWPVAARDNGFLAVFPEGWQESWNAGKCCGAAVSSDIDDMAFLDAVIAEVVATQGGNPDQVFMTGYSNGAMMTFRYLCERPEQLRGAASVAGTDFAECTPTAAIPFLQISGDSDPIVPVNGGESVLDGVGEMPSVQRSVQAVADGADCAPPTTEVVGPANVKQYEPCRDDARVRLDIVGGLEHDYPASWVSPEYVAVDQILDFWGLRNP